MAGSRGILAVSAADAAPFGAGAVPVAGCCAARVVAARHATAAATVNFDEVFISCSRRPWVNSRVRAEKAGKINYRGEPEKSSTPSWRLWLLTIGRRPLAEGSDSCF